MFRCNKTFIEITLLFGKCPKQCKKWVNLPPPPSNQSLENAHTPAANKNQPKGFNLDLMKSLWAKIGILRNSL